MVPVNSCLCTVHDTRVSFIHSLLLYSCIQLKLTLGDAATKSSSASPVAALFQRLTGMRAEKVACKMAQVPTTGEVKLVVRLVLPVGWHLTEGAPSAWQVLPGEEGVIGATDLLVGR